MKNEILAYVLGVAIGDGNLSNSNGRAVRLRITCDTKYPELIKRICKSIQKIAPNNKVSIVKGGKGSYINVSCYSNQWEDLLGWKAKGGSKFVQKVTIPDWVKQNVSYSPACLGGLIETDGSIYYDRGYLMVNFVTIIPSLANDVMGIIKKLNFKSNKYIIFGKGKTRYNIRISKNTQKFINYVRLEKN